MTSSVLAFIAIPATAACTLAWVVRHWALAAAAGTGALGAMVLLSINAVRGGTAIGLPILFGVAIGGLVSAIHLAIRPDDSPWVRMTLALVATTVAGLALLFQALSGDA